MSIRVRRSNGITIALCAVETDEADGDLYLDDNAHYALMAKIARDLEVGIKFPREWAEMDRHRVRDAEGDLNRWIAETQHEGDRSEEAFLASADRAAVVLF